MPNDRLAPVSITSNSSVNLHAHCTKEIRELQDAMLGLVDRLDAAEAEIERLRAALTEITELDLEGDASFADALAIADETLEPHKAS
jgi:hypothetical protein